MEILEDKRLVNGVELKFHIQLQMGDRIVISISGKTKRDVEEIVSKILGKSALLFKQEKTIDKYEKIVKDYKVERKLKS